LSDITRRAGSINNQSPVGMMRKVFRFALVSLGGLVCLLATIWAVGALYFDLPIAWLCGWRTNPSLATEATNATSMKADELASPCRRL